MVRGQTRTGRSRTGDVVFSVRGHEYVCQGTAIETGLSGMGTVDAEASVQALLENHWPAPGEVFRLPIDVSWLAEEVFGFRVEYVHELPDDISGWLEPVVLDPDPHKVAKAVRLDRVFSDELPYEVVRVLRPDPEGRRRICVNASHSDSRRRYTVAHELAHHVMHESGTSDSERARNRDKSWSDEESEAEQFGANLLMPSSAVYYYWPQAQSSSGDPIGTMAKWFMVSRQAMEHRVRKLGLS